MTHSLSIVRRASTDYGTPGRATLDDIKQWDTLELPWRGNKKGISCIKADAYKGWLWYSPSLHRWVVRLEDKHGRGDCLLHNGNFAGDSEKGLETQVHGCTEFGHGYGEIPRNDYKAPEPQYGITASNKAMDELIVALGGDPKTPKDQEQPEGTDIMVTYSWEEGARPEDDV